MRPSRAALHRVARVLTAVAAFVVLGSSTGCGSSDAAGAAPTAESSTSNESVALGAPHDEAALTFMGAVARTNSPDGAALDLALIEQLDPVEGEVYEPWTEADLGFRGVLLRDVLDLVGVDPDATTVAFLAHDDYVVELPIEDIDDSVVLATRLANGDPIPVAVGGPTRLLFLDDGIEIADPDNWIWSIATVTVR
jgi:hypothetical protein